MATAILNLTSFDAALKVKYPDMRVKQFAYQNHPFLAMVPKNENFTGKNITFPAWWSSTQGASATFSTAQANKISSNFDDFAVTRVRFYSLADIDHETMLASQGDAAAFLEQATGEIDAALYTATRDLATALYRSGTGSLGTVGALANSDKNITLANPSDVVNFEVNMEICCSTSTDGGDLDSDDGHTITSIDRSAGILYTDVALTGIAVGSHLYRQGDAQNGTSNALPKIAGLAAWLPSTAPAAGATFFGVTRFNDSTRLAGLRVDGTGKTVEEALIDGAALLWREGGRPDVALMNPEHEAELDKNLAGRMRYDSVKAYDADISFESIKVRTGAGSVNVVADPDCPKGVIYLLQLDTWKLASLGPAPTILKPDGLRVMRNSASDSVEVRTGYYANLMCFKPGLNARISIDT